MHGRSEETYRYTQLVVCTTHQLLKFKEAFDVLIIDEVDAFPYVNNKELLFATKQAIKKTGTLIYLTATPSNELAKKIKRGNQEQLEDGAVIRFAKKEYEFLIQDI